MQNSCRVCFTSDKIKLLSLFTVKIDEQYLADMVMSLTGLEISHDDNLPSMICIECLGLVTTACDTRRRVIEADHTLRSQLNSSEHHEDVIIEIMETVEEKFADTQAEDFLETGSEIKQNLRTTRKTCEIENPAESENIPQSKIVSRNPSKLSTKPSSRSSTLKQFSCDLCSFASLRKKNVERHILAIHLKLFKFQCTIKNCTREYTTRAALGLHYVRDHDRQTQFKCEKCNAKFSCQSLLKIHKQRLTCRPRTNKVVKESNEKTLACPHCEFKTAHKFSLTQHINLKHLNVRKTWTCSHCKTAEFSNRISLNQHLFDFHNLSHIRCAQCDQAFLSEDQLQAHKTSLKCNARKVTDSDFELTAAGVKCNLCQRNYRSKKEWTTHYFNHHKFDKVCDICNMQLATYASLKNHKKTIHEKIKAFKCTECPKEFSAKHTLQFHLNTHSGLKPFACKWCSFKASDRSSISKHQKKLHADSS